MPLLGMGQTDEHSIRSVLTIVKCNNEYERIADCGVNIAERVLEERTRQMRVPDTFRVMSNSVIGMLRTPTAPYSVMMQTLLARYFSLMTRWTDSRKRL